ncbi:response regulator transcription factor [Microbacterium enclense]|uniref:Two component transcriptional regulator, LuxR family n=1 Tax=Microbacterium enclense TaxID=993073 RepID=A0A1G6R5Z7_9MICO|nr:response regulator transcription factor [Microbacterium enclense]KSU51734.1 two-component system response regulator [Microbacterium enclense]MCM3615438.1 response regulator transcription factor [Microbacterium enclense]SDC99316.1 two component transcriptional regulator, LuxR family [Microbacterium enclense]
MASPVAAPIRVVVVDDEALIRSGFRYILDAASDIEVVGTADGVDALDVLADARPDVVLLDIRMPGRDGLEVLREIRSRGWDMTVAILTTFDSDDHIAAALEAGAAGFLVKDTDPRQLPQLVRTLHGGGVVFSPTVSRAVVAGYLRPEAGADAGLVAALTDREKEILVHLGRGLSNIQIGAAMFLSPATVKAHISTILGKLGVEGRVSAALVAERAGLLRDGDGVG